MKEISRADLCDTSAIALDLVLLQTKAVFNCDFFIPDHNFFLEVFAVVEAGK